MRVIRQFEGHAASRVLLVLHYRLELGDLKQVSVDSERSAYQASMKILNDYPLRTGL